MMRVREGIGRCLSSFGVFLALSGTVLLIGGCPFTPPTGGCTVDADCDDGNECTMDACNASDVCVNDAIACPGPAGPPGADGLGIKVTDRHGTDMLLSTGEFADAGKFFATAAITSASADAAGTVTVNFTVQDADGEPVSGLTGVNANIVKLVPAESGESYNKWVPYIYRTETVSGSASGDWPNPDGTTAYQGYRENAGTFTDHGNGSYSYLFAANLSSVTVDGAPISYDRSSTHRVSIMLGGHAGATADATFDFVPAGSAVTATRNIVQTATCMQCHGIEFHGHGGDRLSVENCATCHVPGNIDPESGNTVDFKVMIHKIHAGGEVASIPGPDGILWDNPATAEDESADNGEYAIWGFGGSKHDWWKVGFPAVIENCTKCHQGSGEQVDNWKNVPSRAACGSCHDDVDFAAGTNHGGGPQATDTACTACHPASGAGAIGHSVTEAHDWTTKDARNTPEFDVNLTVSQPANGSYFDAGETPVVTIRLTDKETGSAIDHTTVMQQSNTDAEGCLEDGCPPRDGLFAATSLFVHGPRARRVPVLSTAARAKILADGAGPFNLSAADSLTITFDGGKDLYTHSTALRDIVRGMLSVDVADGAFGNLAAATAAEIMVWLNADSAFAARGIAYMDEATGLLAIRSRNLGDFYSVQLASGEVTDQVFGGDTDVKVIGGFTVANSIAMQVDPTAEDPKVAWFSDRIEYTLDPVDDLAPGTYLAGVELGDRGRPNTSNYKTPSVAKRAFQVKQATEELAVANNCDSCHQGPEGTGFVLDFYRHNKIFDHTAVDQCGQCHDYQSASALGDAASSDGWNGARPISRRVHAVHFGSSLNYPLLTVNYSNADPVAGRNWDITFPQDVRNCEACHPADETSGTWATNPGRTPCSGCHDSDAATAHFRLQTWDPTPENPWSGDEVESCKVCHGS